MKKEFHIKKMTYSYMIKMTNDLKNSIDNNGKKVSFIFNFDKLEWIDPSGAVIFIETINSLKEQGITVDYKQSNEPSNAYWYAINLGIFHQVGFATIPFQEEGKTYLSPQKITRNEVLDFMKSEKKDFEGYSEYISDKISSKVLKQNQLSYDKRLTDLFTYVIRELIRNIFHHSKSEYYFYGSQYLPRTTTVELVIADRGVGLNQTIPFDPEEKYFKKNTTGNAIKKAFTPGITASSNHSYASQGYENSGFGLAMVQNLILKAEGALSLATSDKSVTYNKDTKWNDCDIEGTIIRFKVDLEKLASVDFDEILDLVQQEAKSNDESSRASKRSQTL